MKYLFAVLALTMFSVPALAQSDWDSVTCFSPKNQTVIEVGFETGAGMVQVSANSTGETRIAGFVKVIKHQGKASSRWMVMSGTIIDTTKGPSVELSADDGTTLTVAAPASGFPSEFVIDGVLLPMSCR